MLGMLGLAATIVAIFIGYLTTRRFVRTRLRFVDAIQRRRAPWLVGVGAALIALPLSWVLPLVGTGTALLFGAAVGTGVAHGARDVRRGTAGLLEGS